MIQINLNDIVKDQTFFSVNSKVNPPPIFQGFLRATPRHPLMYKALEDVYTIDNQKLQDDYLILVKNLYNILLPVNDKVIDNVHLFVERWIHKKNHSVTYDQNDRTILIHYPVSKTIPI